MAQAQQAPVICTVCQTPFGSDTELRQHMQAAHGAGETTRPEVTATTASGTGKQGCPTSFLNEHHDEMDPACERTPGRPSSRTDAFVEPENTKEAGGEG